MNDFCKGCTDRGGETCALPTRSERVKVNMRYFLASARYVLGDLGEASAGGNPTHDVSMGTKLAAKIPKTREAMLASVAECIAAHQVAPVSLLKGEV